MSARFVDFVRGILRIDDANIEILVGARNKTTWRTYIM
jgi:hypothetical protein